MGDLGLHIDRMLPASKIATRGDNESLEAYLDRVVNQVNRIHDGLADFGRRSRIQALIGFTDVVTEDGTVITSAETGGALSILAAGTSSITVDPDSNSLIFTTDATGINSTFASSEDQIPTEPTAGDLLYIKADFGSYKKGEVYSFDGESWQEIGNRQSVLIANEASDMPDEPKIGDTLYIETDFSVGETVYIKGSVYTYTATGWQLVGQQKFSSNVSDNSELPANPSDGYIIYVDNSFDSFDAGRLYQYVSGNWQVIANKTSNYIAESTDDMPDTPLIGDIVHINADFTYESHNYTTGQRYQFNGSGWILLKDRVYNTTITDGMISITLNGYVTDSELSSTLGSYYTSSQVNSQISSSLSSYATKTYVNNAIPSLTNYATKSYVNSAIPSLSNYQQIDDIISANGITESWSTSKATGCYLYYNGIGFWDTVANQWPAFLGMQTVNGQKKGYFYVGTGGTGTSDRFIYSYTTYENSSYNTKVIIRTDEGFLGSSKAYFDITGGKFYAKTSYLEIEMSAAKGFKALSSSVETTISTRGIELKDKVNSGVYTKLEPDGLTVKCEVDSFPSPWFQAIAQQSGPAGIFFNVYGFGQMKEYILIDEISSTKIARLSDWDIVNSTIDNTNAVHPAALKFNGNGTKSGKYYDSGWQTGKSANTSLSFNHGLGGVPTLFFGYVRESDNTDNIQMFHALADRNYGIIFFNVDSSALSVFIDGRAIQYVVSNNIGYKSGNVDVRVIAWR